MNFAFENLDVWQRSLDLVRAVYEATQTFPAQEQFGITSQLRRAATSVPLNIAEGKGRYHRKEFLHFLYNARGSLYETVTLLKLSVNLQYLKSTQYDYLIRMVEIVMSKLSGLINSLK